jgi:hypothetical protein
MASARSQSSSTHSQTRARNLGGLVPGLASSKQGKLPYLSVPSATPKKYVNVGSELNARVGVHGCRVLPKQVRGIRKAVPGSRRFGICRADVRRHTQEGVRRSRSSPRTIERGATGPQPRPQPPALSQERESRTCRSNRSQSPTRSSKPRQSSPGGAARRALPARSKRVCPVQPGPL